MPVGNSVSSDDAWTTASISLAGKSILNVLPAPRAALDVDEAVVAGDDPVDDGQAEAGALVALALVVKKGSKIRAWTCGAMPTPVSLTTMQA